MNIKKNISREEIAEAINIEFGFSRKECLEVVNNIIEIIIEGLETNKKVKIHNFGTFTLKRKKSRLGRNPKTGSAVELSGKHVPYFKPGKELRDRVNNC